MNALHNQTTVELNLEETVLESIELEVGRAEVLNFEKDDTVLTLIKDERGKLKIQVIGPVDADREELRRKGEEFAQEMAQLFAQNRAVEALERLNAEVVEEEVTEDNVIKLKVKRWT